MKMVIYVSNFDESIPFRNDSIRTAALERGTIYRNKPHDTAK